MKKKRLILASILGATALFAGATATTVIISNNSIKTQEAVLDKIEESTLAEDDLFSNGLTSLVVNKEVKKRDFNQKIVSPRIGRQYAYDSVNNTVSIRFYAAITSLDVDAVWTRTLYNSDGTVNSALSTGTKKSTVAYSALSYTNGDSTATLSATDVEDENGNHPYHYFVIYTLKNIPIATYGTCTIDANVELSNDSYVEVSKTGSVETNSTAEMSSYTMDLSMDNTYQGSNTTAGNQTYINGKVKTIYSMSDTAIDTSNLEATLYKNNVAEPTSSTTTTLSFKDDTANASSNYFVYTGAENEDIYDFDDHKLVIGDMFTLLASSKNIVTDNGYWLKFNTGGKVLFSLTSSAKMSISFYQDNNNVKVTVDGETISIGSDGYYSLPKGDVVIEATSNGYLGKIIVEQKDLVTVSGFNAGVAGKQTVTARYKNAVSTYDVYVVESSAYQDADSNYVVTVDKSYTGTIGAYTDDGKGNMFNTISQALEFLQNTSFVPKAGNKILNIGAGYYNEKLEITTPNLTINGSGTLAKGTYSSDANYNASDYAAATIIEYDSLYGVTGVNGFTHTTDSTQTVAIRESATNCTINGVTISNKWNCKAYFDAQNVTSEHRALALLVQSDQLVMNNCALLGYQDTVEFFKGRQYLSECYISGTTDYIFGTNNTTLFDTCEIHSIYNGSTDGGFINAFKGCSAGAADYVEYGAVYYKCDFTADSAITSSNTSIARSWDVYSTVAVIECSLGSHISTVEYTSGTTKNQRYVAWTNQGVVTSEPTTSTVRYYEYGNTGDGKITATRTDVTMLEESIAANYHDYSVIFGKTNGKVTYDKAWNPISGTVENAGAYYYFDATEDDSSISHLWRETSSGAVNTTFDGLTINVSKCKYNSDQNGYTELQAGTISFNVTANSLVTIKTGFGAGTAYSISGSIETTSIYPSSTGTVSYFFEEAQTVTMTITGKVYILQLSIESNSSKPIVSCSSISVSGNPQNELELNAELDLSNLQVKSNNSNGTYNYLSSNEYEIDTTQVNPQIAGTYVVTVTYNDGTTEKTTSFNITYVSTVSNVITTNTSVILGSNNTDLSNAIGSTNKVEGTTLQYGKFFIDATNGKFALNGGDNVQFTAGTKITFTVAAGATVTITGYLGMSNYSLTGFSGDDTTQIKTVTYDSETEVTILGKGSGYLKLIQITYPVATSAITEDTGLLFHSGSNTGVTNTFTWSNTTKTGTENGFSISGSDYSNGGYLEWKNSNTITFDIEIPSGKTGKLTISSYTDLASGVTLEGNSITSSKDTTNSSNNNYIYKYNLSSSGTVVISATSSQNYLNYITITFE